MMSRTVRCDVSFISWRMFLKFAFRNVIESYGDEIIYIQQPDLSEPRLPEKEKKFKGYFKIARHYGWALNQTLMAMGYDQV